jgi:Protein of unknown function (DUF3352)
MRRRRVLAAGIAVVAAAAAVFAAVGFASGSSAVPALGGGAEVAPASTVAFVALDTNMNSAQWQALDGLLAKFPGYDTLVSNLQQGFEQRTGLSWANDVKPALGPEVDVALLPTASSGKPDAVLLTQPSDPAKLAALLHKLATSDGPAPVSGQVRGWTVVGDSQAAVDAVTGATSHLAADPAYQDATGRLEQDALVDAYANGAQARQLLSALGHAETGSGKLVWAAGDVVAASGGLKLDGFLHRDGAAPTAYSSSLLGRIPAGALAVVDFQADASADSGAQAPASPIGAALGNIASTLGGETAVYVSPGSPLPSLTLVTHPSDPQAVLDALNDALSAASNADGGSGTGGFSLGSILGGLQLSHSRVGDALVVSTSRQAVDAFAGAGPKLSADATFQGAREASGMPDQTTGFAYVDLTDALPLVQGLVALSGGTGSTGVPDLGALHTLTAFGSGASDGVEQFTVYLEVG